MNPAQKALWFIESHLADELTLDEIAGVAGISRFHMVRAFAAATGFPDMRSGRARGRREATRAGADDGPGSRELQTAGQQGTQPACAPASQGYVIDRDCA